jgi:adenine-specific DNA-methyltransferase
MATKTKLELTWIGKDHVSKIEPRILIEDTEISYHASKRYGEDDLFDNKLIFGDNLLALKALEQDYLGQVKCVYIDPPYNTGSAFEYYDDGVEHSQWLSLMKERLVIIKNLLREDGVLFCSIDDSEFSYLSILMDEIFGRKNSCGVFIWEKKKKPSFLNASMGVVTEYILAYAKNRPLSPPFVSGVTTVGKKYPLNNAGNSLGVLTFPAGKVVFKCPDQIFKPQDMSEGNIKTSLLDKLEVKNGRNLNEFRLEGEWRYSQKTLNEILLTNEQIVISKSPFRPNHIKDGGEPKKIKNLLTVAHFGMSTYEDATAESEALFGSANSFDYPKPELLISTLIQTVTKKGDIVLDSFAGSGTTAAVAHKLLRRWITIEMGEHCHTHIIPRLKKVIDGKDKGGITEMTDWKGGGGFRYYKIAPSLLQKDKWNNWIINKSYNSNMLAAAVCKHEGFTYSPSDTDWWSHGYSTETDFIYVTTQTLTEEYLVALSEEVGKNKTLLIYCSAFKLNANILNEQLTNLTIKKIPNSLLLKCEWENDDYKLNISNLPIVEIEEKTETISKKNNLKKEYDLFSKNNEAEQ